VIKLDFSLLLLATGLPHLPSPPAGEGRVRGEYKGLINTDTLQLAAGRFIPFWIPARVPRCGTWPG